MCLADRLADELEGLIDQVEEPYRSRLMTWISKQAGRPIAANDLSRWLDEFDVPSMIAQYELFQIVCQQAARIFGSTKGKES